MVDVSHEAGAWNINGSVRKNDLQGQHIVSELDTHASSLANLLSRLKEMLDFVHSQQYSTL